VFGLPFGELRSSYIYDATVGATRADLILVAYPKPPLLGSVEVEKNCEQAGKLSLTARLIPFKPFRGVR
jgi:hypothetical protein